MSSTASQSVSTKKSSPALVLLAWIIVGIPAGWGVYNTVLSSLKLFTETKTTMSGTPVPPAPAQK
jgi:hypothetical protein